MTLPRTKKPSGSHKAKSTVIIYSAYNAAPAGLTDDTETEDLWYAALRSDPRIGGLELPVIGGQLHPHGLARLSNLLDPGWSNTISAMSLTLAATKTDQGYGLASEDPAGRQRALSDIASARTETLRLQERLGPTSVRAFALQSAPRADRSSMSAFTDSLSQIARWDWGTIELLVEHSDALVPGQTPQKGYLTVEGEVEAVQSATDSGGPRIRHLVNWGRSAIEGRSAGTPLEHIEKLGDGLGAFAFSGAAPVATDRSTEWEDVHLGLAADEPGSLLDSDGACRLVAALPNGLSYLGIKTGAPTGSRGTERLQLGLSMLDILC
ncbi:DUF4862 family protein [Pseudarthrobacter sp. MDT3-28]|uniref:DUF4862 family protein n=1 Tax=Pseudarthrobacter raffinosi TaxID=2953651 RepID=UPI00208FABC6|nr:DUF4862 family protein [Pseudarthrobacter sp. MDT3-28]MCO4239239.1 DUF4862 family protein [Pseudarthrobacter sp. MDT3-28]